MPNLKVRDLPEGVHRALRARASSHGHSIEAEVKAILAATTDVEPAVPEVARRLMPLGTLMSSYAREAGLTNEDFEVFDNIRERMRVDLGAY
jgi:plasmid stability protein